jgi:tetratricopeptide (TPR) repeat protein
VPQDSPRIAELRRRVHADPASIAFAQLAEEYRRAGNYQEAVKYCRTGLARHPGYLSARVTLGRALIEVGGLDEAARQFELVLNSAPDNLAALRGMAEIHQRRGDLRAALDSYKRALSLARFDPELEETVTRIGREMDAVSNTPPASEGLSFEEISRQLLSAAGMMPAVTPPPAPHPVPAPEFDSPPETPAVDAIASGAAATKEQAPKRVEPLIDFDAILASLGVPDATPPPVMEMLLSKPSSAVARPEPTVPELPAVSPATDNVAELEREIHAADLAPSAPWPDSVTATVIADLEAWLRVLQTERATQSA